MPKIAGLKVPALLKEENHGWTLMNTDTVPPLQPLERKMAPVTAAGTARDPALKALQIILIPRRRPRSLRPVCRGRWTRTMDEDDDEGRFFAIGILQSSIGN
ncbi:MAG: hypothetical protein K9N51_13995 [Candidatus Pacebacteria bacterium]|nr:hypothetical protein [Candidatus Paceibacterota bacterium]